MTAKSKRQQIAEDLGLLQSDEMKVPHFLPETTVYSAYPMVLSGYGEFTPITVRASSISIDANLE